MIKHRDPKPDDQEQAERAFQLLKALCRENQEIEGNIWIGGFWSILVDAYRDSGFSYEQFKQEMQAVLRNYKNWWEES